MRLRKPTPIWLIAPAILVVPAALVGSSARTAPREFKSAFVKVSEPWLSTVTTLYAADPKPGESPVRPRINLLISNHSDHPLWFWARLTAPPPHSGRTGTAQLESRQSVEFESTQDSILADTDYGLEVVVFSDSALTDTLETNSAQFRFDANTVKAVERKVADELRERGSRQESKRRRDEEELEAGRLPKTYDSVIFVEGKIGLLGVTGLSRRGTLTVTKDSVQYVSKKRTFAIAGAQLRNVEILSEKSHLCVAVDYDDAGATKQVRFVTGLYQMGRLEKVKASLLALKQHSRTE
jgi:hypothetical protein